MRLLALGALLAGSLFVIACGGEDRPSVDVIEDSGSSSASSSASGTGESATAGVVEEKPDDATEVDVTLREWEVAPQRNTVEAGKVYFKVDNVGPEDAHEFVVIRTDDDPGALPVVRRQGAGRRRRHRR